MKLKNTVRKAEIDLISIVLDANVIISGLVFTGPPRQILTHIIGGHIQLKISENIITEVIGVLEEKKFNYPPKITRVIMNELVSISEIIEPKMKLQIVEKDPEDNIILECALETKADYIVTGDSHLLELNNFNSIPIIKPAPFLQLIEK